MCVDTFPVSAEDVLARDELEYLTDISFRNTRPNMEESSLLLVISQGEENGLVRSGGLGWGIQL